MNQPAFATAIKEHYQPQDIEAAQQQKWAADKRYHVSNEVSDKPTKHILSMLPYPSGKLHMGHVRNYTIGDVLSRYYRLKGAEVMQPMGWDAFGLPAENAAIANGVAPSEWTFKNIDYMKSQLNALGLSIDWSREFATCTPDYYKWEQWFFIQMFKKGMVFNKLSSVNWDPVDNCVLANEQVVDGRGWRSGAVVEKRDIPMYYYKITDYADQLLDGLDDLEGHWPAEVITMQRNWIGRSKGMQLSFPYQLNGEEHRLEVFTTRPDTFMGVTYVAVAAEHPIAQHAAQNNPAIAEFCEECKKGSTAEKDVATAEKKGMDTGLTVTHPISGEPIPVWVANYVLMSYGSGAVMAVPAHDERDFEFANKFALPIKQVIEFAEIKETYDATQWQDWYGNKQGGRCINSGEHAKEMDGLGFDDAMQVLLDKLETKGLAELTINYRLRDWGVSRQRYWGCPIPVVHCEDCGTQPVDEADLPVVLPTNIVPDGRSNPLEQLDDFVNTTCPKCGKPAKRETDTFDTFMESSWYYARYASPNYDQGMLDKAAADKWLPVDQYIGGVEHAVMHLLYARFFHKLMRDEGLVSGDEPFTKLLTQGMVNARSYLRNNDDGSKTYYFPQEVNIEFDGKGQPVSATLKADGEPVTIGKVEKMSKSKNNGVDPQETIDKYGADTVRLYTMFTAPADQTLEWSDDGLKGAYNFIKKVWKVAVEHQSLLQTSQNTDIATLDAISIEQQLDDKSKQLRRKTHETIGKIDHDLGERLSLNTPVSSLMELVNELHAYQADAANIQSVRVQHEALMTLLSLLSIYAPHVAEHILESFGYNSADISYPKVDEQALVQDSITMVVQVNGKVRGKMQIAPDTDADTVKAQAKALAGVAKYLETGEIKKEIVVPNKLVNIVVVG